MLIRRCSWHLRYHGRRKWLGIESWRGWWVWFTDGLCVPCADKVRVEWDLPPRGH